jgi:hypothetical protein
VIVQELNNPRESSKEMRPAVRGPRGCGKMEDKIIIIVMLLLLFFGIFFFLFFWNMDNRIGKRINMGKSPFHAKKT